MGMSKWAKLASMAKDAVKESAQDIADASKEKLASVTEKADSMRLTDKETAVIEAAVAFVAGNATEKGLRVAVDALTSED